MKDRNVKSSLIIIAFVFMLMAAWAVLNGIDRTINKTVGLDVYTKDAGTIEKSYVEISGTLKRTLSSTSFVGKFSIGYYAPSCQAGTEAKIEWQDDYQSILFYHLGDFTRLDVERIEIDDCMERMLILLNDGTILASSDYYLPVYVLEQLTATE